MKHKIILVGLIAAATLAACSVANAAGNTPPADYVVWPESTKNMLQVMGKTPDGEQASWNVITDYYGGNFVSVRYLLPVYADEWQRVSPVEVGRWYRLDKHAPAVYVRQATDRTMQVALPRGWTSTLQTKAWATVEAQITPESIYGDGWPLEYQNPAK